MPGFRAFNRFGYEHLNRKEKHMTKTIDQLTRDFLAKHERRKSSAPSPRLEQWKKRKKARKQQHMQERRALARPLLKGV
jgi:hypothetical protein